MGLFVVFSRFRRRLDMQSASTSCGRKRDVKLRIYSGTISFKKFPCSIVLVCWCIGLGWGGVGCPLLVEKGCCTPRIVGLIPAVLISRKGNMSSYAMIFLGLACLIPWYLQCKSFGCAYCYELKAASMIRFISM